MSNLSRLALQHPNAFLWIVRLSVVGIFVGWSATQLDGFSWDYDEGIHVYIAWLVQQGHPLYTETFSPYTPGFIMLLVAAFQLFGANIFVARMLAVSCAVLGLLGVMLAAGEIVRQARDEIVAPLAAELVAAVLLVGAPSFYQWSRAAMSDLPAAAVATFSVALALRFLRDGQLRCLFAAQIFLAYALWIKLIAIGSAAPIAFAMLCALWRRRAHWAQLLIGSVVVAVFALTPLLAFDGRGLYEQAIYFHVQKRAAFGFSLADNWQTLFDFLSNNLTLISFAALTLTQVNFKITNHQLLTTLIWFVASFAALIFQAPLFANHHPIILVFPLAALAGAGVVFAFKILRMGISHFTRSVDRAATVLPRHTLILSATGLCLITALAGFAQYPDQLRAAAAPPLQPDAEEAVALLRAITAPTDLITSDAQMIAFRAQRQSPPSLADTSNARLVSGNLTSEQLIAATKQSDANGMLFWSGRISSTYTTAFINWAEQNYYPVRSSFQRSNSPYRLLLREPRPQHPLDVRIGNGILLLGYDLQRREFSYGVAGRPLTITFYFQRIGLVERAYTIFTHLLNGGGQLVAQEDRPPLYNRYPTDQWRMNEFIIDEFTLTLPIDLPPGEYSIAVGMYERETLQRLPVMSAGVLQLEQRLLLPPIAITQTK